MIFYFMANILSCSPKNILAIPTPSEFVYYLISEGRNKGASHFDAHFKPQWTTGYFCDTEYDYIGRMTTFSKDVANIRKILKIPEVKSD
jgi:hypothetical protein